MQALGGLALLGELFGRVAAALAEPAAGALAALAAHFLAAVLGDDRVDGLLGVEDGDLLVLAELLDGRYVGQVFAQRGLRLLEVA